MSEPGEEPQPPEDTGAPGPPGDTAGEPPEESARRPARPARADDPRVLAFRRLLGIVDRLRDPDGCPWDRKQTEASMAPHLIEEAFELSEAIQFEGPADVAAEAGDVLLNVLLICRIAEDAGRYDLARAAHDVSDKLVRRHPHVFGDVQADTAEAVLANWDAIKREEREDAQRDASALAGLPRAMPALLRARRVCERAVNAGFAWPSWRGAFAKLAEELDELDAELQPSAGAAGREPAGERDGLPVGARLERVADETGDVLLAAAFLAQYLGLDPEALCRASLARFEARFRRMEASAARSLREMPLEALIEAWSEAKRAERGAAPEPRAR